MKTFSPNDNNLGGKKIIDTHKSKHILSVLNATPQVNSMKIPHPHVNGAFRNKRKDIELHDYFKEVNETYKRVNNLKHGYVNHSEPKTFHLRNTISKRLVVEKNVILHDHMRNISHLDSSLKLLNKRSEKRIETIKTIGSAKKALGEKPRSIDFIFAGDLLNNYNPFSRNNNSCYDAADGSLGKEDKKIGFDEEKLQNPHILPESYRNESLFGQEYQALEFEPAEGRFELLKKKVIGHLVKNRIYEREVLEQLKSQIIANFPFLEPEMVEAVFIEIIQHFFK